MAIFDPLYPNLGAYSDVPVCFCSNQLLGQIDASDRFDPVAVKLDATALVRVCSTNAVCALQRAI